MFKGKQEHIDHVEKECSKASVICFTCGIKHIRENSEQHNCAKVLLSNINPANNLSVVAALSELDTKHAQEMAKRDRII